MTYSKEEKAMWLEDWWQSGKAMGHIRDGKQTYSANICNMGKKNY